MCWLITVYGGTLAPPGVIAVRLSNVSMINTIDMTRTVLIAPARQNAGSSTYIGPFLPVGPLESPMSGRALISINVCRLPMDRHGSARGSDRVRPNGSGGCWAHRNLLLAPGHAERGKRRIHARIDRRIAPADQSGLAGNEGDAPCQPHDGLHLHHHLLD